MEPRVWLPPLVIAVMTGLALTTLLSYATATRPIGRRPGRPAIPALLGGLAILLAMAVAMSLDGISRNWQLFTTALALAFATGLWIELVEKSRRYGAAIEVIATVLVVFAAGVGINTLGVFGSRLEVPPLLSLPAAIVAVLLINRCLRPIDVQGFRVWFGFIALAWYTGFARRAGMEAEFVTALILDGAIAGYLLFNVLLVRRIGARVYLGTGGGLMISIAVAVIGLKVSQAPASPVPPIAALWVVLLPVMDTLSVFLGRLQRRADLFERDDRHLQHFLRANEYTETDILFILLWLTMLYGGIGYFAWKLGLSDGVIVALAVVAFVAYHLVMRRAWRKLAGYYVTY